MSLLNIPVHGDVIQINCENQDRNYCLAEDVKNGDWTVKKVIKVGGPQYSRYKYDFSKYLEFVLVDKSGEARTLQWHHYGGDACLRGYQGGEGTIDCIPFFFKEHPVFNCQDWKDFEAKSKLLEVENILSYRGVSNQEKLGKIVEVLKQG